MTVDIWVGNPAVECQLAKTDPGLDHRHRAIDLLQSHVIQSSLGDRGLVFATQPCSGDIYAHTETSNQVGVETDEISLLDGPAAALLVPGVGPGAGGQESRLDPLSSTLDRLRVKMRPELLLTDPGLEVCVHHCHRLLGGGDGTPHRLDLFS